MAFPIIAFAGKVECMAVATRPYNLYLYFNSNICIFQFCGKAQCMAVPCNGLRKWREGSSSNKSSRRRIFAKAPNIK